MTNICPCSLKGTHFKSMRLFLSSETEKTQFEPHFIYRQGDNDNP